MTSTAIVILAGGQSRRMGTDKALMFCGGKTLLDRALELAFSTGYAPLLSVASGRAYTVPPGTEVIPDRYPAVGPLGGMASVMERSSYERYLFVPVDMPLLRADMLKEMVAAWESPRRALFVRTRVRTHPFPLLLGREALPVLQAQIRSANRALMAFLDRIPSQIIFRPGWEAYFANINTPGDREHCD